MIRIEDTVEIGKFQRPHALKGELNAVIDVDPVFLSDGNPAIVEIDGILVPFYAESVRRKGSSACLIKLDGVDSENEARCFVNAPIRAMRDQLAGYEPEDEEDAEGAYAEDLVGYKILDTEAGEIGTVVDLDLSTENALFVVESPDKETIYIPIADDLIEGIDEEKHYIEMTLPEGLVSINTKQKQL